MNKLDTLLQSTCPCVMCPRYEPLELLAADSHRFLIAGDGLYCEVRRPWIHAILKVTSSPIPLPYGQPPELFDLRVHRQDLIAGLGRFIERSRVVAPLEHAAWLTFDPVRNKLDYIEPEVISQGRGHIRYHRPDATPDCLPILDCHSHGNLPEGAFFSGEDDGDDLGDDAKLAFVVGNLDQPEVSVVMRFVGFGLTVDLTDFCHQLLYAGGIHNRIGLKTVAYDH